MNVKKFSRLALFIIYFWFGILKVLGSSPANPLVASLLKKTLPFISAPTFFIILGLCEMALGVLFLLPRYTKIAKILFSLHMITTFMPLILLPAMTWQSALVPTLEGQ